jgi:membrane fusion protein (multidrug efflux system)
MKRRKYKLSPTLIKRIGLGSILFLILLGACCFWIYNLYHLQTDDAYVNANVVQIAPRITGQVSKLYVEDNQFVKKGQVIFEIDSAPFEIAVEKAKAHVAEAEANLDLSKIVADRVLLLSKERVKSVEEKDRANAALEDAKAHLRQAKANLANEQLNLSYTTITAANNGWVTMMKLREGDIVERNRSLFALIDQNGFWVDANFKETELEHIYPGQKVDIEVDMYPSHHIKGLVDSISRGSGAAFSLMPPQNATGNWVKVTQRVPVKILVLENNLAYPLRIGTTASVTIKLDPWQKKASPNG